MVAILLVQLPSFGKCPDIVGRFSDVDLNILQTKVTVHFWESVNDLDDVFQHARSFDVVLWGFVYGVLEFPCVVTSNASGDWVRRHNSG